MRKFLMRLFIFCFAIGIFLMNEYEASAASYPSIMLKVPYYPQKVSGDCGISSIAMIEAYALGYDKSGFDTAYAAVYAANNNSLSINSACSNGKYVDIQMNLESYYKELAAGRPILIRREPYEHWSVIVGYTGSSSKLEQSGFVVWDTKRGVSACNYNEVTTGKKFDLSRWLKAPNWNSSAGAYVDQGSTSIVRARVRGTGAISGSSGGGSGSGGTTAAYTLSNTGVTSITDTTARINASVSPIAGSASDIGFYYGTSTTNMKKVKEGAINGQVKSIWYDLGTGKWTSALTPGTTYYYQIYAVINGVTYTSAVDSFKTTGDIISPTISDVKVTDVTKDGYTVSCKVVDNAGGVGVERVCFPTWSVTNGQDDLSSDWYNNAAATSISGNTYSFRVKISEHKNDTGDYVTHIYAYDKNGNYAMADVTAYIAPQVSLKDFSLNVTNVELQTGNKIDLNVSSYTPANTTDNKAETWTSANTAIATVDAQGNVTAVSCGKTTIYCTVAGIKKSCQVTVKDVISLNTSSISLSKGKSEFISTYVNGKLTDNSKVTWTSSNTSVATCVNGKVTAVGKGTATISCSKDNANIATCKVTVTQPVTGITLNKSSLSLNVSKTSTLTATVSPSNADNTSVTWSTSDKSVATVNANGVVTAVGKGTATITAKAADGSGKSATCKVTVTEKSSQMAKVETPTITLSGTKVIIETATEDSVIYYTTDGSTPTTSNGIKVESSKVTIDTFSDFVKAIAVKDGYVNSDMGRKALVNRKVETNVSFAVKGVFGGRNVTFNSEKKDAKVYYSATTSRLTTNDKCVNVGETVLFENFYGSIYARTYCDGEWGSVCRLILKIPVVNTPTISIDNNGYATIRTTTPSCHIYYTTDGSTPSMSNGKRVTASATRVYVGKGTTVKAIAVRSCFTHSGIGVN